LTGDLKPENVLLDANMHAKLNDFGTAKIIGNDGHARSNSFTGTAEYLAPELLKEKASGKPSDLWSLGCVVYQLLTGDPPFKGQNEYLTFQLIINRTFSYPDYISPVAKDLIEKLLEADPLLRLGVGEEGLQLLKKHPFFDGIDWANLHTLTPPTELTKEPTPPEENNNKQENNTSKEERINEEIRAELLEQQKNSSWSRLLEPEELVTHNAMVWKKKGLFSKKRLMILTDKPRLFYVDADKMAFKGEIPWSVDELTVEIKNPKRFTISVPNRVYYLEDISANACEWGQKIADLQRQQVRRNKM